MEILAAERVYAGYGKNLGDVLRGLSLSVGRGETVAIIGQSGCGKSTLLKVICGLVSAHTGVIRLRDEVIIRNGRLLCPGWKIRRQVVLVTQEPTLFPHYTVRRNIGIGLESLGGKSKDELAEICGVVARELQLADEDNLDQLFTKYPEHLSGGQKQRVQLARALVVRPDVLLLDEVTSNIDPETTEHVVQTLWRIKKTKPEQSIVIVSHLFEFVERFADRVVFLHQGLVHEEAPAPDFRHRFEKPDSISFVQRTF